MEQLRTYSTWIRSRSSRLAQGQYRLTQPLGIETKKYSTETCGIPGEDRRSLVWITASVFGILGLAAFGLRFFARIYVAAQTWGPDDLLIGAAVAVMIPLQVLSVPRKLSGLTMSDDRGLKRPHSIATRPWPGHVECLSRRYYVYSLCKPHFDILHSCCLLLADC